ncbi:MAG TPA: hypothetical protein VGG29_10590 [Caulobacteraceae bacterium]|jgi:energy-coupling factor transporter ATP-binding protein EcfA2
MPAYRIAGLVVDSQIALPGALSLDPGAPPDVVIGWGPAPAALARPTVSTPGWEIEGELMLMRVPGVGRFLLCRGRQISVDPADGADPDDCAIYLLGSVFGALLHQRGQLAFHASAIEADGRAVMICGPSGRGKSTTAAALAQLGHPLLSDDLCALSFDADGAPRVHADGRQLKLAPDAVAALDLAARAGARVRSDVDKRFVAPPAAAGAAALPLAAVYILRAPDPDAPLIADPGVSDAVRRLQRNAYRPGIVERTGQQRRYFEASAAIVAHAGVFLLAPPRDLARLPQAARALAEHWTGRAAVRKRASPPRGGLQQPEATWRA